MQMLLLFSLQPYHATQTNEAKGTQLLEKPKIENKEKPGTLRYTCIQTINAHGKGATLIDFAPGGRVLASIGWWEYAVKIWDVTTGKCLHTLTKDFNGFSSIRYAPNGQTLAVGAWDGSVHIWDAKHYKYLRTLTTSTPLSEFDRVYNISYAPNSITIAAAVSKSTVKIWNIHTGACLKVIKVYEGARADDELMPARENNPIEYAPNGQYLACTRGDLVVSLNNSPISMWKTGTYKPTPGLKGHKNKIACLAYSPNGSFIASASEFGDIKIWDVVSLTCLHTLEGCKSMCNPVCYTTNGKALISSGDNTIQLWDTTTYTFSYIINAHSGLLYSIRSTAYHTHFLVWGYIRKHLPTLRVPKSLTDIIKQYADSETFASAGEDGTIKIWQKRPIS